MNKLKFTLILQARLKSTRFKEKVLKKLGEDEIVKFLQKRLITLNSFIEYFILAVPSKEVEFFRNFLIQGFKLEGGSEENVLERFAKIFEKYDSDYLIRATSDNPFVSLKVIKENIEILENLFENNQKLPDYFVRDKLPLGTQTEFVKKEAFWESYQKANKSYHFEHVTPYIYENTDKFFILKKPFDNFESISNLRLTIDTEKDYIVAQNILKYFDENTKPQYLIDFDDIERIYLNNKSDLEININEIQKNYKD
ncbi:MAG: hypothetical protein GYA61_00760 [Spirochaetales bacterium]|jgi:spore coat polysaccharide biosynthesis protein SpsF|nr:hypothetical protein [Exilispira sp.]NMC66735.1 hypothetical protein [Spirochaetales bacterium]